ncbi:hypothetical protein GOP47_0013027 [Adiantum capillus-veneris]|uniref:Uncharacterized protein n=1 Tax=Adiantum capillus-veneris TaxID=13818 RepID=A0A9D4URZ6_ADICA|nr:hypothetical protein GOP47_0013027 [Adiantum capillus-veneris]
MQLMCISHSVSNIHKFCTTSSLRSWSRFIWEEDIEYVNYNLFTVYEPTFSMPNFKVSRRQFFSVFSTHRSFDSSGQGWQNGTEKHQSCMVIFFVSQVSSWYVLRTLVG